MSTERLTTPWRCQACDGRIHDPAEGVAVLLQSEMRSYHERQQQLQQLQYDRIRDGGLGMMSYDEVALTEKASWRMAHTTCVDEDADELHYRISLAELTDASSALDWLCHLMEQEWPAAETDFAVFMRRHVLGPPSDGQPDPRGQG